MVHKKWPWNSHIWLSQFSKITPEILEVWHKILKDLLEKLAQKGGGTKICFGLELEFEPCKGVYNLEDLSS